MILCQYCGKPAQPAPRWRYVTAANPYLDSLREAAKQRKAAGWRFAPVKVGGYVKD